MNSPATPQPMAECWRVIGIDGDRSCRELVEHLHCQNCPVYTNRGRELFDRPPPDRYRDEWAERLAAFEAAPREETVNLFVFRLGEEWLALDVPWVVEVTTPRRAHRIPHRSNDTLAGMVNIRGELYLTVRLEPLLGLESQASVDVDSQRKLLVLEHTGARWVALVDEVHGVHRFSTAERLGVPATVAQDRTAFACEIYRWGESQVGRLDGARLLDGLRGRIR